jgi:hypothetical protein
VFCCCFEVDVFLPDFGRKSSLAQDVMDHSSANGPKITLAQ